MNIRNMEIGDYEGVLALWRATPGVGLNDFDDSRDGIAKYLRRNPTTCFVAEDGRIVGAILSGHDGRRGFIYHTAVEKDLRGRGVGSALLDAAIAALRAEGIRKVAGRVRQKRRGQRVLGEARVLEAPGPHVPEQAHRGPIEKPGRPGFKDFGASSACTRESPNPTGRSSSDCR